MSFIPTVPQEMIDKATAYGEFIRGATLEELNQEWRRQSAEYDKHTYTIEPLARLIAAREAVRDAFLDIASDMDAEGLVIVPREATGEMLVAMCAGINIVNGGWSVQSAYRDLIAASPPPTREA